MFVFPECSNNAANLYTKVYYAEQFRQLRELIFPEGEERLVDFLRIKPLAWRCLQSISCKTLGNISGETCLLVKIQVF